jgi:hypothetical protein
VVVRGDTWQELKVAGRFGSPWADAFYSSLESFLLINCRFMFWLVRLRLRR